MTLQFIYAEDAAPPIVLFPPITRGQDVRLPFTIARIPAADLASTVTVTIKTSGGATVATRSITTTLTTDGQLTDTGASGTASGYINFSNAETTDYANGTHLIDVWLYLAGADPQVPIGTGTIAVATGVTTFVSQIPASAVVSPSPLTITQGQSQTFTAVVRNADGVIITPVGTWTSLTPARMAINSVTGVATAGGFGQTGTVTIRYVTGTVTVDTTVTVALDTVPAGITVSPPTLALDAGLDAPALVTVVTNQFGDVISVAPTFTSLATGVATVGSSSGIVHGVSAGSATIRATAGTVHADCAATIAASAFAVDWRVVSDRFTPRVLADRKNGPLDDMAMTGFIKNSTTWGITHVRGAIGWQAPSTVPNDGHYYNASGVVEDAYWRTKADPTVFLSAQVNTPTWQGVLAHPSQKFYFEVDAIIPAGYDAATIGQAFRVGVFQGTDPNNQLNPFIDPLDPTFVKWQGSLVLAARSNGYAKFRTAELPVSTYTAGVDIGGGQTGLFLVIWGPAGYSGATLGLETTAPRLCAGRLSALNPLDNGQHAPVHDRLGLWYTEPSVNCALWSDDYTNAVWTKTGVTVTAGQGNCPDFADTGSQWSRLAFTSGGTLAQTCTIQRNGINTPYVPDYVWVSVPAKQDGATALPADGDLIADLIGTVGTTSADLVKQTIDGHVFYHARVPYKATNAGETNTTPVVQIRAKASTTPQLLAVRLGVEPEKSDASDRDIGTVDMIPPMFTTSARAIQAQTMSRIVRGQDVLSRQQGFYRGRIALPYNPMLLPVGADKRLGYQGPAASVAGFDPKIGNQAGTPQFSCSWLDGVGGHSSDIFSVPLDPSFFDTTTEPGLWIFDWAVRWSNDHFDGYWFNGVKGIPSYTPGAGTTWATPGGPLWGPIDCDNVCGSDGWEQIRQCGLTAPSDSTMASIVATR